MSRAFSLLLFILSVLLVTTGNSYSEIVNADTTNIYFPTSRSYYQKGAPTQTGVARRSEAISIPGLYEITDGIPEGYTIATVNSTIEDGVGNIVGLNITNGVETKPFSIFNAGNKLPLFNINSSWFTYIRTLKDFYNDRNFVWAGDLQITGNPMSVPVSTYSDGWIPNDGVDALVDENGKMMRIFRFHKDHYFRPNVFCPYGPNWRYQRIYNSYTVELDISSVKIDPTRQAKICYALYNEDTDEDVKIEINGTGNYVNCQFLGKGEKFFSANIPSSYLYSQSGTITATITNSGSGAHKNHLDFLEVYVPILEDVIVYDVADTVVAGGSYIDGTVENPETGEFGYYNTNNEFIVNGAYTSDGTLIADGYYDKLGYPLSVTTETSKVPNSNYYDSNTNEFILPKSMIVKVDNSYTGPIKVNCSGYAIALSDSAGQEKLLFADPQNNIEVASTAINKLFYFSNAPVRESSTTSSLQFEPEKELQLISTDQTDYLAILPSDYNYFLQLRSLITGSNENVLSPFVLAPWQEKIFASDLYQTWLDTEVNGKTISDIHIEQGLNTLYLKLEDIIDVYACGIYSPEGVKKFIETSSQTVKYVCLGSGTACGMKKQATRYSGSTQLLEEPFYLQVQGVPTEFFHGYQVYTTTSDDIYSGGAAQTKIVGRVIAFTSDDLATWLKRRITYSSPDSISLWSGQEPNGDNFYFQKRQEQHKWELPSISIDYPIINDKTTVTNTVKASINSGTTLGIYQGHGSIGAIDSSQFLSSTTSQPNPACYIWGTCNTGEYYLTGYSRGSSIYSNLAYHYMKGLVANSSESHVDRVGSETVGAVNIIAASGLAAAVWENRLIGYCIDKVASDKSATWGEMFQYAKSSSIYNEDFRVYHLFGDPALQVLKDDPRIVEFDQAGVSNNKITAIIKGDWNTAPQVSELKVKYGVEEIDGTVNWLGELPSINLSLYSNHELINPGVSVDIDLSSITVQDNIRVGLYSSHTPLTRAGESFDVMWSQSLPIFTPAYGISVSQTGNIIEWSVEIEDGVKQYDILYAGQTDTIIADGSGQYSYELPPNTNAVIVIKDHNGFSQTFYPTDGEIVKVAYELNEGWNLIAMPGANADISNLKSTVTGDLWMWTGSSYKTVDESPKAGTAVWVYSPSKVQTTVSARKCETTLDLKPGWNMVGPTENIKIPSSVHSVYEWREKYRNVIDDSNGLIQGVGYWIFVIQ